MKKMSEDDYIYVCIYIYLYNINIYIYVYIHEYAEKIWTKAGKK
jgi:hypothetical protein